MDHKLKVKLGILTHAYKHFPKFNQSAWDVCIMFYTYSLLYLGLIHQFLVHQFLLFHGC